MEGSAQCLSLVEKGGQRTMRTYLGASLRMQAADFPEEEALAGARLLHVEGRAKADSLLILYRCIRAHSSYPPPWPGHSILACLLVVYLCPRALSPHPPSSPGHSIPLQPNVTDCS